MMYLAATVFPAPLSPLGTGEARNGQWPGVGVGVGKVPFLVPDCPSVHPSNHPSIPYCPQGPIPGTRDTIMNKTDPNPCLLELT